MSCGRGRQRQTLKLDMLDGSSPDDILRRALKTNHDTGILVKKNQLYFSVCAVSLREVVGRTNEHAVCCLRLGSYKIS